MSRQPSILVVDDEVNVARTLQMILEREGYAVTSVHSSREALAWLRSGRRAPDAILTDLNMEREDIGFEVARHAKKLKPRPVVVIFTGYANQANTRRALEMRVDYLALKPVDVDELRRALARLLAMRANTAKGREKPW